MAMINYADKVALNSNNDIADINKVNATDMNEIKNAINNQVAFGWYQTGLSPTLTYSSWDSTTKTGVVNTNLDLTGYLSIGMKVKFTQSGTTKYGFITKISSGQITIYMGNSYTLDNSGISNAFYSMLKAPYGFPLSQTVWTLESTLTSPQMITSPVSGTVYNPGDFKIVCPIGDWEISYKVNNYVVRSTPGTVEQYTNLSTSVNSFAGKMGCQSVNFTEAVLRTMAPGMNSNLKRYEVATTIYCCTRTAGSGNSQLGFYQTDYTDSYGPAYIRLKPAYL